MRWRPLARTTLVVLAAAAAGFLGWRARSPHPPRAESPGVPAANRPDSQATASQQQNRHAAPPVSPPASTGSRRQGWVLEALGGLTVALFVLFLAVVVWPDLEAGVGARQALLLILVPSVLALFLIFALWLVPKRQLAPRLNDLEPEGQISAENAARLTLAQIVGGLFLFISLAFGWRQLQATDETTRQTQEGLQLTREELRIGQEAQITERFTRAIEQVGSEKPEVRLGGIYALERIARDSQRDYEPVMQVLTSLLRERASREQSSPASPAPFPEDAQAVITVLVRREEPEESVNCWDLSDTDLRGADFSGTQAMVAVRSVESALATPAAPSRRLNLRNLCLSRSDLTGARLAFADLRGSILEFAVLQADLGGADLSNTHANYADFSYNNVRGANLSGAQLAYTMFGGTFLDNANLSSAFLFSADLSGAHMSGANLTASDMTYANLTEADLTGANMTGADLTAANLTSANLATADLTNAKLSGLDLRVSGGSESYPGQVVPAANLAGTDLRGAILRDADLRGVDLRGARNLTQSQVDAALVDAETLLPAGLHGPQDGLAIATPE